MRLSLRQLQIFAAIADTGSTTAAGNRVALSQSATSGALNELENLLGTRLFDRVGKRLLLNDMGRVLLPQARTLLDGAQALESQFLDGGLGAFSALRIGASTTIGNYLLPALIAGYLRSLGAQAAEPQLDVTIGNTADIVQAVTRLEVDLGLIEGPCHEPALQVSPWLEDELVIVCAPSHPLVLADPLVRCGVRLLREQRWLLREPGSGTRETVEGLLLPHLHHWQRAMQLGSTEAIKQAAVEGLGLACLSSYAVRELLAHQALVAVNSTLPRLLRRFYLIHHRKKQLSAPLQRFVALCEAA